MDISSCLSESAVSLHVDGSDKPEILRRLVDVFVESAALDIGADVLNLLLEREKLKTTGIGSGVAIPHCKTAAVDRPHIVVGLSRKGIDFQSLDKLPTHMFFLVVAPQQAGATHLKICARIARLVKDTKFKAELLELQSAEDVVAYIKERESGMS